MIEFLLTLIKLLDRLTIPYAIGGSFASSYYGEPRTTQDVDISIQLSESDASALIKACEEIGFYIPPEETSKAAQSGGSFSVNDGFWKADLFVVKESYLFAAQAFQRRRLETVPDVPDPVAILSPEDKIVHKLRWCEGKPLDKHMRDMVAVLKANAGDSIWTISNAGPYHSTRADYGRWCWKGRDSRRNQSSIFLLKKNL